MIDAIVLRDQAQMLREMASRRRVCGNSPGEVLNLEMIARSLDAIAALRAEVPEGARKIGTITGTYSHGYSMALLPIADAPIGTDLYTINPAPPTSGLEPPPCSPPPLPSRRTVMTKNTPEASGAVAGVFWDRLLSAPMMGRELSAHDPARYEPLYRANPAPPTSGEAEETEQSIAADCYHWIADCIGTLPGYSVQEHVQTMKETLEACSDFLHDFVPTSEGGSDEAVALAKNVRCVLSGRIDQYESPEPTPADESGADGGETIRPAFERWAGQQGLRLDLRDFKGSERLGQYCEDYTQLAFEAWREAARLAPSVEAEDAARLDWLAHHGASLRQDSRSEGEWFVIAPYHTNIPSVDDRVRYPTFRAAIDAARRARGADGVPVYQRHFVTRGEKS